MEVTRDYAIKSVAFGEGREQALRAQMGKQEAFNELRWARSVVRAPRIVGVLVDEEASRWGFVMQRKEAWDIGGDAKQAARVMERLLEFVRMSFRAARKGVVSHDVLHKKVDSVLTAALRNPLCNCCDGWVRGVAKRLRAAFHAPLTLPMGYSHGDLTLCNVLLEADGTPSLIDFLPSFVDSPVFDVVKLRQDTLYGWVGMLNPAWKEALPVLDRMVIAALMPLVDPEVFRLLSALNLFRILPYVRTDEELKFVTGRLALCEPLC